MLLPCVADAFNEYRSSSKPSAAMLVWAAAAAKADMLLDATKFAGMSLVKGEQHNMNMMLEARVAVYRDQRADQSSSKVAQAAFQWISCSCSFPGRLELPFELFKVAPACSSGAR